MSERLDESTEGWPLRPWIMAAICSAAGLAFHLLTDHDYGETLPVWRQAGATFVAVATLSFVVTVERLRWLWALGFALGWGLVTALVGWFTAGYSQAAHVFEWPYLSGLFAVLLAAPLFQTVRDQGAWRFPYRRLHSHAWTDAVIGAASLVFTGVTFLLAWLIAGLFDTIGIEAIKDLLEEEWFGWMLAGFAFGAAFGLLRERDRLVATLQRLVMVVFSVLAPVLAFALVAFLLSIPFTGLGELWDSWVSATVLLLLASAGAILLANAVIGDGGEDRSPSPLLNWSALALIAVILPLAVIAAVSMGVRINQYGWTPERIWGVIAVAVAVAYGFAGWWSIWRGRRQFDDRLRPLQTSLAIGLCGLALFLALPILDFGAISARSQVARLHSGEVEPEKFDWAAMAFDFGPAGRERLREIARSGPSGARQLAETALAADERWGLARRREAAVEADDLAGRLRPMSDDIEITPELRQRIAFGGFCPDGSECRLLRVDAQRLMLVVAHGEERHLTASVIDLSQPVADRVDMMRMTPPRPQSSADLDSAQMEIRPVTRRQLYVNGEPVGELIE